jgi:hypothetical protein
MDTTSARVSPKEILAKLNKTNQFCLVLFGFIRPKRDFSMSCDESKYKKFSPSQLASRVVDEVAKPLFAPPDVGTPTIMAALLIRRAS